MLKQKNKYLPLLGLSLACCLWGVEYILVEIVLGQLSPAAFSLLRLLVAALTLGLVALAGRTRLAVATGDLPRLLLSGGLGLGLYLFFENQGVRLTSGAVASMILACTPIMGLAADRLFYRRPITGRKTLAALGSMAGVALIVADNLAAGAGLGGSLMMLGAAAMWTAYITASKPLLDKYSAVCVLFWQTLAAAAVSAPLALDDIPATVAALDGRTAMLVAIIGVCCTTLAQFVYARSLRRVSVSVATLFENLAPLASVVCGLILLGTLPTAWQLLGGGMVILCVLLAAE